jgi:hypothetical protein
LANNGVYLKAIKDEPTIVNYRSLNGVVSNEKDDLYK